MKDAFCFCIFLIFRLVSILLNCLMKSFAISKKIFFQNDESHIICLNFSVYFWKKSASFRKKSLTKMNRSKNAAQKFLLFLRFLVKVHKSYWQPDSQNEWRLFCWHIKRVWITRKSFNWFFQMILYKSELSRTDEYESIQYTDDL